MADFIAPPPQDYGAGCVQTNNTAYVLAEIDAKMDDGNLATGRLKKAAPTRVIYVLASP